MYSITNRKEVFHSKEFSKNFASYYQLFYINFSELSIWHNYMDSKQQNWCQMKIDPYAYTWMEEVHVYNLLAWNISVYMWLKVLNVHSSFLNNPSIFIKHSKTIIKTLKSLDNANHKILYKNYRNSQIQLYPRLSNRNNYIWQQKMFQLFFEICITDSFCWYFKFFTGGSGTDGDG